MAFEGARHQEGGFVTADHMSLCHQSYTDLVLSTCLPSTVICTVTLHFVIFATILIVISQAVACVPTCWEGSY